METFKSHPEKDYVTHIENMFNIHLLKEKSISDIVKMAFIFHDLLKSNTNFQKLMEDLANEIFDSEFLKKYYYKNHSYLGGLYFLLLVRDKIGSSTETDFKILTTLNIIVGHHTHLRDIDDIFYEVEWKKMVEYFKKDYKEINKKLEKFFDNYEIDKKIKGVYGEEKWNLKEYLHSTFNGKINLERLLDMFQTISRDRLKDSYKENKVGKYLESIMSYSHVINADRRDASGNYILQRTKDDRLTQNYALKNNLRVFFNEFTEDEQINRVRNTIRKVAVKNIKEAIRRGERVFSFPSSTGSGKTDIFFYLYITILEEIGGMDKFDLMYCVPRLTITDELVEHVTKVLKMQALNYTSTSDTSNILQKLMKENKNKELLDYAYNENCFEHPFVITTTNELIETIYSHKSSKLAKLENFKNRIIIIDECHIMQSNQSTLNMRVLREFCKKYNSYLILGTATMPSFEVEYGSRLNDLIPDDSQPTNLLEDYNTFDLDVFNRYKIKYVGKTNIEKLVNHIDSMPDSSLVILNTKKTCKIIYNELRDSDNFDDVYIYHTEIRLFERRKIEKKVKEQLRLGKKVLLIATQAVQAGVNLDFPCGFRDAAPPPEVVQSFGRVNRNNKWKIGRGYLFQLEYEDVNKNGKTYKRVDSKIIYGGDVFYLSNLKVGDEFTEKEFHKEISTKHFKEVALTQGDGIGVTEGGVDIIHCLNNCLHKTLGERYKYIEDDENDNSVTVYIGEDKLWEDYKDSFEKLKFSKNFQDKTKLKIQFNEIKKKVISYCISLSSSIREEVEHVLSEEVFGIRKLEDLSYYKENFGIDIL